MINQLKDWLANESALLKILNPKANQAQQISTSIKQYRELLNQDSKERYEFIHKLIKTVSVLSESAEIKIDPKALIEDSPHPIESITLTAQAKIERCGMAMRLLVGNKVINQQPDINLIQTIRNGQDWLGRLTSGQVKSIGELAKELGMTNTAVTNMIHRAFLAPDIIRAIMNGTQPINVTGDFLKRNIPLPLDWDDQRKLLGFE